MNVFEHVISSVYLLLFVFRLMAKFVPAHWTNKLIKIWKKCSSKMKYYHILETSWKCTDSMLSIFWTCAAYLYFVMSIYWGCDSVGVVSCKCECARNQSHLRKCILPITFKLWIIYLNNCKNYCNHLLNKNLFSVFLYSCFHAKETKETQICPYTKENVQAKLC